MQPIYNLFVYKSIKDLQMNMPDRIVMISMNWNKNADFSYYLIVEVIDDLPTATFRRMANIKKDQYTTVEFGNVAYDLGMKDDIFTERYLKNPPREYIQ